MGPSTVRLTMQFTKWIAFCVGALLNGLMVRLIIRHTPKSMRIYSNILLQTCFTDLALLTMTLLFQKYTFTTVKGENEVISDGLVVTFDQNWRLFGAIAWIFLVYISLFGYVTQFIYRYLLLNWDKKVSTFQYFLLFFAMLIFPLIYCLNLFFCYYMPVGNSRFLDDQTTADILGMNVSDQIPLTGYTFNDWKMTMGLYYIIIMCTIAYTIMITLAFLIENFLKKKAKAMSTSAIAIKVIEMNKQISRNLAVQASMPLFIYLSILFLLCLILLKIDARKVIWLQYFNLLSIIPMFLPSALNPIVSICVIKNYRKIFVSELKLFAKFLNIFSSRQTNQSPVDKWAVITKQSVNLKSIA